MFRKAIAFAGIGRPVALSDCAPTQRDATPSGSRSSTGSWPRTRSLRSRSTDWPDRAYVLNSDLDRLAADRRGPRPAGLGSRRPDDRGGGRVRSRRSIPSLERRRAQRPLRLRLRLGDLQAPGRRASTGGSRRRSCSATASPGASTCAPTARRATLVVNGLWLEDDGDATVDRDSATRCAAGFVRLAELASMTERVDATAVADARLRRLVRAPKARARGHGLSVT